MAVVHYKFKNSVEYDSLTFDGLSISLRDLKLGIMKKKRMRTEDNDLQVVNAQTGEVYSSPSLMIPKNTSLIIARIPVGGGKKTKDDTAQNKAQKWAAFRKETQAAISAAETGGFNTEKLKQSSDLVNAQSSEIEKIAEMMKQSTKDFDPSNYTYKFPTGVPNPSYICRKCGKGGHYIQNCTNEPLEGSDSPSDVPRMKRPTGIPVDSMVFVDEPLPGTYQTHSGKYAVPKIDVAAYVEGKKERPPFLPEVEKKQVVLKRPIPKELKCPLCGDLAKDAVVIPCCGISYCDECIRNKLLETEDHVCPSCDSMDVSPDGLIANQMLRRAVTNFQNETGYVKRASDIKQAQAKAAEAAKAAAAASQVLKMQAGPVVPRGPSVLDYKPQPKPPTPPAPQPVPSAVKSVPPPNVSTSTQGQMKVNVTPQKSYIPVSVEQEPPTPTQDEPIHSSSYTQPQVNSSVTQNISVGEPLQTLVGQTLQPVNRNPRRPATTGSYDPYYKPLITSTSVPPPTVPPYPPPTAFPPPGVPPPFVPPPVLPLVRPPIVPPVVPPVYPATLPPRPAVPVPAPPINMPKPLSKTEFLEEKNRILREELQRKDEDPLIEFAKKLEQRKERSFKSRSRSRSPRPRSRSLSRPRYRSRSRGRSFSRSPRRSFTPRRSSLSPRRSYSPRKYSPRRSRSPRYSPRRYYSPRRSRSPRRSLSPRPRYRSYSRSPVRRRSFTRSRSRDRRSPFRRSLSRSPLGRRSPFRRSYSRGRYTPPRRSLSPYRRSPPRRSRSRGRSPINQYRRSPMRYSPKRKRSPLKRSPGRRSKSPLKRSPPRRSKSPLKRSPLRRTKDKPLPRAKSPKQQKEVKKRQAPSKQKDVDRKDNEPVISDNVNNNKQVKLAEPNKENIPAKGIKSVNTRSNNIVINIVDSTTTDDNSEVDGKSIKADCNQNENAVSNKSNDKTDKSAIESKANRNMGDTENKQATKSEIEGKLKSRSRSKSKEKAVTSAKQQNKPRKKRSPKRKKSVSLSPERVKSPLRMPYRERDRFEAGRGRMDRIEGGRDRFDVGRGGYGREWDRSRDADPYFRGRQNAGYRGRDFRGRGRGSDFRGGIGDYRGQQPPDFRNQDFRPPPLPQQPGDFGAFPPLPDPAVMAGPYNRDYPQRGSPGFPANYGPNFAFQPPRDPREDPNLQGLVRDEDIVKFEQYKQLYDFYSNSRTYGFPPAPVTNTVPTGQTPPQGPPPAPPGTTPVPTPTERAGSPGRRRSISPRRHRSRSPGRREGKDRRDRERDYRDKRSPERRRDDRSDREDRSLDRKHEFSPEKKHTTDESGRDDASPEKKSKDNDEKESKKERKARRKKEKAEGGEKKKKKKKDKDKTKSKKDKAEKKAKKLKMAENSENEEQIKKKSKTTESQNESDSERSDSDTEIKAKIKTSRQNSIASDTEIKAKTKSSRQNSVAQSDSSDHEKDDEKQSKKAIKKEFKDEDVDDLKSPESVQKSVAADIEINEKKHSPENIKQESEETKVEKDASEKQEKRRSIKRGKPDAGAEEATDAKKAKLEEDVKEESREEKMDTSGGVSPGGSEGFDDIPHPEDELMLDPPELSKWEKWEKDDDPYDLSPEPSKAREKWKPGKQTFLPRSVIEKAEHALAQKVMKPTTVSSAVSVIQPVKKENKSESKEVEPVHSKREKSPLPEPKRRVFMEPEKKKDERRIGAKQQHNVKITVTGDEKRKVATENDLRNKLREKRRESEHSRDYDRSRDRDRDRSPERVKRKDSHSFKDRRSSRDYDRQDSRGARSDSDRGRASGRTVSRKESVIDDSRFVPDYEDESYSEDENSEDSSTDSSSDEEVVHKKHKHKKNKHKKEKKLKKKKEKKKKKHKGEKEKKVKSSLGK